MRSPRPPRTDSVPPAPPHSEPPADLEVVPFEVDGQAYALLEFRSAPAVFPGGLTESEWLVALLVLAGHSSRDIARIRGVAARTVSNQLAAIYQKLGLTSRRELVTRWSTLFETPPSR